MFRFFSDFGGETAPRPSPEIAENREKSKKLRSGQCSPLLEVFGKGFGMIFNGFGERSEGMLRHGVRLFKAKNMAVEIQSRRRPTRRWRNQRASFKFKVRNPTD